jgi:hypothetical protein
MISGLSRHQKSIHEGTHSDGHLDASQGPFISWNLSDSFNLRLLIHYVGDIHQPLHAISRFNEDFPIGDRGGNEFTLPSKDQVTNLHSLWDSVLYS